MSLAAYYRIMNQPPVDSTVVAVIGHHYKNLQRAVTLTT
jgi:hypothetical protein